MPTLADLFRGRYLVSGADFDSVRVHYADAGVDRVCRALGARAFTVGSDIYFAAGAFRPDRRDGRWLLAHEVAHVLQQSAGLVRTAAAAGPAAAAPGWPALTVAPPGRAQERAADAAADAFVVGRPFTFSGAGSTARAGQPPVLQRYMAWEHSPLGDLDPARVQATAAGDPEHIGGYRDLLAELGRTPRQVDEARLRASYPGLDLVRLPASGLVVTLGGLNVLPDYLGRPEEIETAPLAFIGPLIQSVRSWSSAELGRPAGQRGPLPRAAVPAAGLPSLSAARPAGRDGRDRGGHRTWPPPRLRAAGSVRLGPGAHRLPLRPVLVVPLARVPPDGPLADRTLRHRERGREGISAAPGADLRGLRRPLPAGFVRRRAPGTHPARGRRGSLRAARAAEASRRAIAELLQHGATGISSWDIFDSFPSHVEQDGGWSPSANGTRAVCVTCAPACSGGGQPAHCGP